MAVFFLDSCQDYSSVLQKYSSNFSQGLVSASGGRTQAQCIAPYQNQTYSFGVRLGSGAGKTGTGFVGFAFKATNFASWNNVVGFTDSELSGSWSDNFQVSAQFNTDHNWRLVTGLSTVLATTSTPPFSDSNWHYIELGVKVSATVGTATLKIDGVTVLSVTSANTKSTSNAWWNGVFFGGQTFNQFVCDIYMADDSGSAPWNTFLGDQKVYYAPATANAGPNNFTPQAASRANSTAYSLHAIVIDSNGNLQLCTTAGTSGTSAPTWSTSVGGVTSDGSTLRWTNQGTPANWKYISNVPAGDSQAYLSDGTVGDEEMYDFAALSASGQPTAVGVNIRGWKDQTYACTVRGLCDSGGTTADNGTDLALSATAFDLLAIFETDPHTGSQWASVSAVNSAAFGVKVTAA